MLCSVSPGSQALEKANAAVEKAARTLEDNKRDKLSARNIADLEKDVEKKQSIVKRIETDIENRKNIERMIEVVKVNLKEAVPYRRMPYEQNAMVYEICKRNHWYLPPKLSNSLCFDTTISMLQMFFAMNIGLRRSLTEYLILYPNTLPCVVIVPIRSLRLWVHQALPFLFFIV